MKFEQAARMEEIGLQRAPTKVIYGRRDKKKERPKSLEQENNDGRRKEETQL